MKSWLVAALLASVALAGCTDDSNDGDAMGDASADGEGEEGVQIVAPEWSVGDYWTYENTFGPDWTLVVTEDDGADWIVDTDSANLAFFHDAFGDISYLGKIRKSDLAGSQGSERVNWLDFPLEPNKEWTTTWDGFRFDMVSHVSDDGDVAHIIASLDGVPINQMVYDASVGWFTSISFGNTETGEEFGSMELKDSGSGFSGELVRVDAVLAYEESKTGGGGQSDAQIDSSEATDDADAYLIANMACAGPGQFTFAIGTGQSLTNSAANTGQFEDQGRTWATQCPYEEAFAGVIGPDPGNGDQWGYAIESSAPDLELSFQLYWRNFERITI